VFSETVPKLYSLTIPFQFVPFFVSEVTMSIVFNLLGGVAKSA
jgi:hypothetical protein